MRKAKGNNSLLLDRSVKFLAENIYATTHEIREHIFNNWRFHTPSTTKLSNILLRDKRIVKAGKKRVYTVTGSHLAVLWGLQEGGAE